MEEGPSTNLPKIRVSGSRGNSFANKHLSSAKVDSLFEGCNKKDTLAKLLAGLHSARLAEGTFEVFSNSYRMYLPSIPLIVQESETQFAVSPSTPLLSTAIDENSLICGEP
jgi:hypothetical protein